MRTVVIIPTYNERKNIGYIVPILIANVPGASVLVVDDNSPDGTAAAVGELQKEHKSLRLLKREKKEGLGKAYLHAFKEVLKDGGVDAIVTMDADSSHNPKYIPAMLGRIAGGDDLVIGSRYVAGGGTEGWELWRKILSRGGSLYARAITGMPVYDATGGFNAMRAAFLRGIDLDSIDVSGYAFQIEMKHAMYSAGARISELPILFINRKEGESKMSSHIIREGVLAPWKMRLKKRK